MYTCMFVQVHVGVCVCVFTYIYMSKWSPCPSSLPIITAHHRCPSSIRSRHLTPRFSPYTKTTPLTFEYVHQTTQDMLESQRCSFCIWREDMHRCMRLVWSGEHCVVYIHMHRCMRLVWSLQWREYVHQTTQCSPDHTRRAIVKPKEKEFSTASTVVVIW